MNAEELLFPFDSVRETQKQMVEDVYSVLQNKSNLIVHAPTGIGKTAAVLSPALSFALKNDLTVFFLTSRHTQHHIAIETLKKIKERYNTDFIVADMIGKQKMCLQDVEGLPSSEFYEYCKKQTEGYECEFYVNARKQSKDPTVKAKKTAEEISKSGPQHVENVISICQKEILCPYEISSILAKKAQVIIADYYTIFEPNIRSAFFGRCNKELEKSIIVIDEGHNLPQRLRNLQSMKLSSFMLNRSIQEARKLNFKETNGKLLAVLDGLRSLADELDEKKYEKFVKREDFINAIGLDYDELISDFTFIGDEIREKQKYSYVGGIANFLEQWLGPDEGFARIIAMHKLFNDAGISLQYLGLDPSLLSKEVVKNAYSSILMSGTLTPTSMYKDILGFENAAEKEYKSPFPKHNRLNLIIPDATTKFTHRNDRQFQKIAKICLDIINYVPGNCAVFFPSYELRDEIGKYFAGINKKIFVEDPKLSKLEKAEFLERFKSASGDGAVLLSAATGSFGEGIDLPNVLKAVIVVGIPLTKPDLETKALIDYYQKKFGKGWDYGYILPAVIRSMQNAGRCIRSETDRGVIIFLDERYSWQSYYKCFPQDWDIRISKLYAEKVKEFFKG